MKRLFDMTVAGLGFVVLSPLFLLISLAILVKSGRPVLFSQTRVGRHGHLFSCVKFRTMQRASEAQGTITTATDSRVTPLGRVLRRWKLDELPQLWNVLIGRMSFVGPRPDVPGYADRLQGEVRQVLGLLPGITGPATLLFRDEEQLLALARDPKAFNDDVIYPEKLRLNLDYMKRWSFIRDVGYIIATVIPAVTKRVGVDRWLGLDYESFRKRMEQELVRYRR